MDDRQATPLPSPRALVLMAVIFEGGLGLVAAGLGAWWDCPPAAAIHATWPGFGWGLAASLPMLGLFLVCLRLPVGPLVHLRRLVEETLVPLFRDCQVLELLVISVLAGLGEEMLFRGVLQEAIAGWWGGAAGPWVGLGTAALLFGVLHALTPTYAFLAAVIGAYLGWLWMATANLLVPITAHGAYDFFVLVYLVRWRKPAVTPALSAEPPEGGMSNQEAPHDGGASEAEAPNDKRMPSNGARRRYGAASV